MTAAAMVLRAAADGRVAADCRALLVELLRPAAPSPPGPSGHSNFALHRESAPIVGGWEPTHKCGKIPRIPEVLKVLGTAKHQARGLGRTRRDGASTVDGAPGVALADRGF